MRPEPINPNFEQLRASHALATVNGEHGGQITRSEVNKLPALIVGNGLLATAAFASETNDEREPKRPGMKHAMDSVATLLAQDVFAMAAMSGAADAGDLISKLSKAPSTDLQRATAEALAYLAYLKRFVRVEGE